MNLNQRLTDDMKLAMKAKETLKLQTIRALKATIKNGMIDKGNPLEELSDVEIVSIIRKQVKQRIDSNLQFIEAGRMELAQVEATEQAILEEYLPKDLSADEIDALIGEAIEKTGATSRAQMGAVMSHLKITTEGRVDGKLLSQSVIKALS